MKENRNILKERLGAVMKNQELGIFLIFLVLCLCIQILTPKFLKPANIINILRQISNVGIMAVGEAMVIIIAGIDLSVSAVLSLSACTAAYLAQYMNPWLAVLAALLTGVLIGCLNGFLSVKIGIAPFIATLGTQMMTKGLAFMITSGIPIKFTNEAAAPLPIDKQNTTQRECCMESGERCKGLSPDSMQHICNTVYKLICCFPPD